MALRGHRRQRKEFEGATPADIKKALNTKSDNNSKEKSRHGQRQKLTTAVLTTTTTTSTRDRLG